MQVFLILGIVFAIGAVTFALQNNAVATVVLGFWHYESSLAVLLLVALAMGALIAGLVSTPSVLKNQWNVARLRRQVAGLEADKLDLESRVRVLEADMARDIRAPLPAAEEAAPYVGLRTLLRASEEK